MNTICVAIPCYKPHIPKLIRLLESIQAQTLLPHQVVISCSSMGSDTLPTLPPFPFPVEVITHAGRKNAAENRNCAAERCVCDILTFMDSDDIMHPQRLEFIEKAFRTDVEFVVHSYFQKNQLDSPWAFYDAPLIENRTLALVGTTAIKHIYGGPVHQSQCSIRSSLFLTHKFDESPDAERREDSLFCSRILQAGVKSAYIGQEMSKYDEAGFWISV